MVQKELDLVRANADTKTIGNASDKVAKLESSLERVRNNLAYIDYYPRSGVYLSILKDDAELVTEKSIQRRKELLARAIQLAAEGAPRNSSKERNGDEEKRIELTSISTAPEAIDCDSFFTTPVAQTLAANGMSKRKANDEDTFAAGKEPAHLKKMKKVNKLPRQPTCAIQPLCKYLAAAGHCQSLKLKTHQLHCTHQHQW